jgi:hypothetical protein
MPAVVLTLYSPYIIINPQITNNFSLGSNMKEGLIIQIYSGSSHTVNDIVIFNSTDVFPYTDSTTGVKYYIIDEKSIFCKET